MPRVKLEKFVTPKQPVNHQSIEGAAIVPAIDTSKVGSSAPAIEPLNPVTIQPIKEYLRLAGTNFLVDPDTGAIYLNPTILKAMQNK